MTTAQNILDALYDYGVKPDGKNRYRCNSPFRQGSDSRSFSLTIETDGEHGAWHDFVSDESGSLYELAERLGIRLPDARQEPVATYAPPAHYETLASYAEAHGASEVCFRTAGWEEVREQGRAALSFRTETGTRYRFLDGAKPKFWHAPGYQRCWYGLVRAIDIAYCTRKPLILCNGEPSAVVGQYYGLATACVTGSGEKELPPHLLAELQEQYNGQIIVALDSDATGRKAAPKLVAQLRAAGVDAWSIDLGGPTGFDLADFCKQHGSDAWHALPSLPPQHGARLGKSGRDLMLKQFPDVAWIVQNLLPEGLSVCAGKPKLGKSWLWLNVGLAVAGDKGYVLGTYETNPTNTLYLSLEDGERRLQSRIEMLGYTYDSIPIHFEYEDSLPRLDDGAIALIEEWITRKRHTNRFNLIIIDTLVMVKTAQRAGRSIYEQDYSGLTGLRDLAQNNPGTAVLLIHHTKKGTEEDVFDMMSGSTGLQGVVESEMILYKDKGQVYLEVKGKDIESTRISLFFDGATHQWVTQTDINVKVAEMSDERQAVLDYISEVGSARPNDIATALNQSYNGVLQTVKRLRDDGFVTSPRRGIYEISPDIMTHDSHDSGFFYHDTTKKPSHGSHEVMNPRLLEVETKKEYAYGVGD